MSDEKTWEVFAQAQIDAMAPATVVEDAYLRAMAGLVENFGVRIGDIWTAQTPELAKGEDGMLRRTCRVLLQRINPTEADKQAMQPQKMVTLASALPVH